MAREWQQTKLAEYVMPNEVYYQSIWAVRDFERMAGRLRELEAEDASRGDSVKEAAATYLTGSDRDDRRKERMILEQRVEGIRRALMTIPREYRSYVISNIVMKNPGTTFPNRMWRIWKQRFLYQVAHNLLII